MRNSSRDNMFHCSFCRKTTYFRWCLMVLVVFSPAAILSGSINDEIILTHYLMINMCRWAHRNFGSRFKESVSRKVRASARLSSSLVIHRNKRAKEQGAGGTCRNHQPYIRSGYLCSRLFCTFATMEHHRLGPFSTILLPKYSAQRRCVCLTLRAYAQFSESF